MENLEFNRNEDLEHSFNRNLEVTFPIDGLKCEDFEHTAAEFAIAQEYAINEPTTESTDGNSEQKRKKRLKMMMAMLGTSVVISSSGILKSESFVERENAANEPEHVVEATVANSSSVSDDGNSRTHTHEKCTFLEDYNDYFDKILSLADDNQYTEMANLIDSETMEEILERLEPGCISNGEESAVEFVYNGEFLTDCREEYYNNNYSADDMNLFFHIQTNERVWYDGTTKHLYQVKVVPKLAVSQDYLVNIEPFDIMTMQIPVHSAEQWEIDLVMDYLASDRNESGIIEIPIDYLVKKLTVTGFNEGMDCVEYRSGSFFVHEYDNDVINDLIYVEGESIVTCALWNNGPRGEFARTDYVPYVRVETEEDFYTEYGGYYPSQTKTYVIDENGKVDAEQSYIRGWTNYKNIETGDVYQELAYETCIADDENMLEIAQRNADGDWFSFFFQE